MLVLVQLHLPEFLGRRDDLAGTQFGQIVFAGFKTHFAHNLAHSLHFRLNYVHVIEHAVDCVGHGVGGIGGRTVGIESHLGGNPLAVFCIYRLRLALYQAPRHADHGRILGHIAQHHGVRADTGPGADLDWLARLSEGDDVSDEAVLPDEAGEAYDWLGQMAAGSDLSGDALTMAADVLTALGIGRGPNIAVEDRCWAETVLNIQNLRPDGTLSKASAVMMPLRRIKDEDELAIMRKAGVITEAAYAATLPQLRHGMTNLDLISEVKYQLKKHGAFTDSFVTSFYNMGKSYPFDFTNREEVLLVPLDAPVSVSFDFGAAYDGYCYDYGRSVFFGEPDEEYRCC